MSKKKVLIIAHLFPPYGGVGVMRALGFVKYLRDFGWEPVVLAAHTGKVGPQDPSLLEQLPAGIKIYRQHYIESIWLRRFFKLLRLDKFGTWLENFLFIPDPQILWLPFVYKKALEIIKTENIDLIFSTSAPYSSHLLANKLKQRTGLPWVADFRDPWTENPYAFWPTQLHKLVCQRLEKSVLLNSDIVTATSPYTLNKLIKLSGKQKNTQKFNLITNGFDPESIIIKDKDIKNKKFTIKYLGSIFASRPPLFLFKAISELLSEKKINTEKFTLEFIGNIHLDEVPTFLKIRDKLSHQEFILETQKADVLLLISEQPDIVPAKFFEYLMSEKFILALSHPHSYIPELLKETSSGIAITWNNIKSLKNILLEKYTEWENTGKISNIIDLKKIENYSRKNLTAQLVNLFDKISLS